MSNRLVYTFLSSLFASFARCFRLPFVKKLHYGIERSLFSYRVGSCEGSNLEDSSLAAVIENYFEGRVEPVEVASAWAGPGEDHSVIEPALVGSAPAGADFPNWEN